ncbi:hypothetical protein ACLD0U_02505 [Microbacterium sp. 2216-1]|uniref:hypothetical protein n=1 Tax=Microbacterium TaxID=33882 RepID=UPI001CD71DDB|nr:hypothetical protein [Microbacterium esteraromaticum]MCA1305623.1 hypothetical protein [Microbacterium esteraromaticum]
MDPFWAMAAELWWVAPVVIGGATTAVVVSRRASVSNKRLGYDAARLELRQAQQDARVAADNARVARAEATRVTADRAASRTDSGAVAAARRALREAQLASKAATARVKAARARVVAERTALSHGGGAPLERMRHRHDAVLTRWMEYETDPDKLLAFPAMSDARAPATAAFLAAVQEARELRPNEEQRVTASDYGAYRDAVERLERAFDLAERSVRGEKLQPDGADALRDAARTLVERTTDVINRTSDVLGMWTRPHRDDPPRDSR